MEWLFGKKLSDPMMIKAMEEKIGYQYPAEYKALVLENDGGIPTNMIYDTAETKERVFNNLLSFEKWPLNAVQSGVKKWDIEGLKWDYVPFARDPFGNMICFDRENDHVIFWDHETRRVEEVASSFTEFIDSLYDDGFEGFDEDE